MSELKCDHTSEDMGACNVCYSTLEFMFKESQETIKVLRKHLFNVVSQLEAVKSDKDIDVASAKAALLATAKEGKC